MVRLAKNHNSLLDLFRFTSAFLVVISHYFLISFDLQNAGIIGYVGVEFFFVLSGFVLAPQLNLVFNDRKLSTTSTFLIRRWIRTIPPYLLALVLMQNLKSWDSGESFLRYATYTQNILFDNSTPVIFAAAWSLSVEEWSYVLIPLLYLSFKSVMKKENKIYVLLNCLIAILFLKLLFLCGVQFSNAELFDLRRSVLFRIDAILIGICFSYSIFEDKYNKTYLILISMILAFNTAVLIMVEQYTNMTVLILSPLMALVIIYISVTFNFANKPLIKLFSVGAKLSYPMYLYHLFVLSVLPDQYNNFSIYMLVIVLISASSYYGFERYLLMMRPKYNS